jgi:hypothetical protein
MAVFIMADETAAQRVDVQRKTASPWAALQTLRIDFNAHGERVQTNLVLAGEYHMADVLFLRFPW